MTRLKKETVLTVLAGDQDRQFAQALNIKRKAEDNAWYRIRKKAANLGYKAG